jgi:hypothetical protein
MKNIQTVLLNKITIEVYNNLIQRILTNFMKKQLKVSRWYVISKRNYWNIKEEESKKKYLINMMEY